MILPCDFVLDLKSACRPQSYEHTFKMLILGEAFKQNNVLSIRDTTFDRIRCKNR